MGTGARRRSARLLGKKDIEHRIEYEFIQVNVRKHGAEEETGCTCAPKGECISQCSRPRMMPRAIIDESLTDPARLERRFDGASPYGATCQAEGVSGVPVCTRNDT